MRRIFIPPIKTQGIKTKLVDFILTQIDQPLKGRWIEPFLGSGVVGFNLKPLEAIFCDINPHIVNFYNSLKFGMIRSSTIRNYLEEEGEKLLRIGIDYYYTVRDRFNKFGDPLDFLFLNRSSFNGLIRFNSKGEFNTPSGKKRDRFSKSYITKIVNQVRYVECCLSMFNWTFLVQDFRETISSAEVNDILYCDPPYIGRHSNYYDVWSEKDEMDLFELLSNFKGKFILSTWVKNKFRENEYLNKFWNKFNIITFEHFYHIGGREINRNPMIEALVLNFEPKKVSKPYIYAENIQLFSSINDHIKQKNIRGMN